MHTLGVILARAGSKGLPDKCVRPLLGRAVIDYTFDHARAARSLGDVVLTTDSVAARNLGVARGIQVIDRPPELAHDTATVDEAVRHAVRMFEQRHSCSVDAIVILYGNIPVRAVGVIDRVVKHLRATGADSVRTVAPVSKQHPDWIHRLEGDRMVQFRSNSIYRRQDLEPLYYHDGAVIAVTRRALFAAPRWPGDHQGFLGEDRRAVVQEPHDSVDIDTVLDFHLAEALLRGASAAPQVTEDGKAQAGSPEIVIGPAKIGLAQPVYVIAEAGVNHNGSREVALGLVAAAAEAGANAVKFQAFRADALVTAGAPAADYQQADGRTMTQRAMLSRLELGEEDFAAVRDRCAEYGLEFLATPFGLDELDMLLRLGVRAVKLASTDLNYAPLVEAAVRTGLPLLVSTGAASLDEIAAAVRRIEDRGAADRTVLLHCISSYPAPWEQANLRAIPQLASRFLRHVGFSDHTTSENIGALAVAAGARVIEKHLTLDRGAAGPDHAISLAPASFCRYVAWVREAESALGCGRFEVLPCEQEVRRVSRRSVVAARNIAAGEVLSAQCLAVKRPGGGIEPGSLDALVGRRAAEAVSAETQLTWEMIR